jgi:hypothetical protein
MFKNIKFISFILFLSISTDCFSQKIFEFISFILFLSISTDCFSQKIFEKLESYEQLKSFIEKNDIELNRTLFVFDIDNTLVKEFPRFINQDFSPGAEQFDQVPIIAEKIGIKKKDFIEAHNHYLYSVKTFYDLTESCLPEIVQFLHTEGAYLMTCTNSTFRGNKLDSRIKLLLKNDIDFSRNYNNAIFDVVNLPFYAENYKGHTSSRKTSKVREINTMFSYLNLALSVNNKPSIKNLVFIDNTRDKAEEVFDNINTFPNVYALYYTHVRDHIDLEEIASNYKVMRANVPATFSFDVYKDELDRRVDQIIVLPFTLDHKKDINLITTLIINDDEFYLSFPSVKTNAGDGNAFKITSSLLKESFKNNVQLNEDAFKKTKQFYSGEHCTLFILLFDLNIDIQKTNQDLEDEECTTQIMKLSPHHFFNNIENNDDVFLISGNKFKIVEDINIIFKKHHFELKNILFEH